MFKNVASLLNQIRSHLPLCTATVAPRWLSTFLLVIAVLSGLGLKWVEIEHTKGPNLAENFYHNGDLVALTNDASYWFHTAKSIRDTGRLSPPTVFPEAVSGLTDRGPYVWYSLDSRGYLLPGLLAWLSTVFQTSIEKAGILIILGGSVITVVGSFLFFSRVLSVPISFVGALAMAISIPVNGRTAVGMVDTDILNLAFPLFILTFIFQAVTAGRREAGWWPALCWTVCAGLINYLFYLWYDRSPFTLIFLVTLWGLGFFGGLRLKRLVMITCLFLITSGPMQLASVYGAIDAFIGNYLSSLTAAPPASLSTGFEQSSKLLWSSVQEASKPSVSFIGINFGSVVFYVTGLLGLVAGFILVRGFFWMSIAYSLFIVLFHFAGIRFAMYIAPHIWVGNAIILTMLMRQFQFSHKDTAPKDSSRRGLMSGLAGSALASAVFLLAPGAFFGQFMPLPNVFADDSADLKLATRQFSRSDAVVATWWAYGGEASYQAGLPVIMDETGSQTGLKALYFAMAMTTYDPEFAAKHIRAASYSSEAELRAVFPNLPDSIDPEVEKRDIVVFLPVAIARLQRHLNEVAVSNIGGLDMLRNYDPGPSVLSILLLRQPNQFGPFRKLLDAPGGSAIYLLPGRK